MRIVYIDIDTLRPDHLGCYGYHRNTSPNIDQIAREGARFDNYYTSDAPCLPSRAAMMSGKFGIHNGAINHNGTAADMRIQGESRQFVDTLCTDALPAFLNRDLGLHTCYIGGFGARHASWSYYAGFREIHDTGLGGMESAEDVTPSVLDWVNRNGQRENWYLHVNYWDPHTPYRSPEEFGNPFKDDPLPGWLNQDIIDRHMKIPGPHTIQDLSMYDDAVDPRYPRQPGHVTNMDEMRELIDGYDCGIRYADQHVGMLIDAFKAKGIMDDLIIIVSSDHGENFGELGIYAEHGTADHICSRVPLIVRWPGKTEGGAADRGLHYNIDLAPTLAEMNNCSPRESWDGESFAASLTGSGNRGRNELVLGQCAHGCQRSVRWDDWIYIRSWHDGYHCFDEEMLFNLEEDPQEQNNIALKHPDILEIARGKYDRWFTKMMETMPYGYKDDPMQTVLKELPCHCHCDMETYSERLRKTGRENSVEIIAERHPDQF